MDRSSICLGIAGRGHDFVDELEEPDPLFPVKKIIIQYGRNHLLFIIIIIIIIII
jgi:hypothetical protein